jgi:signal transduction histidine kinase
MKPLLSEERDSATLQNLGRASFQIIHDIKNQLNGLKLYATYLRKRMERSEESAELQETVAKLIGGLDRAANDLNVLVQYGRPISLSKYQGVDIEKLVRGGSNFRAETAEGELDCELIIQSDPVTLLGEFDSTALVEAFKAISVAASKTANRDTPEPLKVTLRRENGATLPFAVIEWEPVHFVNGDPFHPLQGNAGVRLSLAAKIVEAHGGTAEHQQQLLRVRLPLSDSDNI